MSKEETKKELKDSIINGEQHENKELEEKASKVLKTEDATEKQARKSRKQASPPQHTKKKKFLKNSRKMKSLLRQ